MFSSPSTMLCGRESRKYDDPSAWHNKFFCEVTCNIDEEIFRPLFAEGREGGKDGRPNAPIRILIAMSILKEGSGCSDEALFENCCFNMLYRSALGLVTLQEQCPSIDSYYTLRRNMVKYQEKMGIDLFDKCFKGITRKQALEFYNEDAQKTIYRTDSETMRKRLLTLGLIIDHILSHTEAEDKTLLRRVFSEQYDKAEDGTVSVRDKKLGQRKERAEPQRSRCRVS